MDLFLNEIDWETGLDDLIRKELEFDDAFLNEIFQYSTINLLITNLEDNIIFASKGLCQLLGYSLTEIKNLPSNKVLGSKLNTQEKEELLKGSGYHSSKNELITHSGKNISTLAYTNILKDSEKSYILSIFILL